MKTAISIEDSLMEKADSMARDLGLSRSALVAEALRDYLKRRLGDQITEKLNQVYGLDPDPVERKLVRKLRSKLRVSDKW